MAVRFDIQICLPYTLHVTVNSANSFLFIVPGGTYLDLSTELKSGYNFSLGGSRKSFSPSNTYLLRNLSEPMPAAIPSKRSFHVMLFTILKVEEVYLMV